ncbi:MAG TPA: tetratricopeptide repeat protein [Candidatus Acidoferrales bacterium]|nr:tetratricopeptide repeat protein [Candidatus Acidoferrales bacterium]
MTQEEANAAARLLKQGNAEDLAVRIIEECPDPEERSAQLTKHAVHLAEKGQVNSATAVLSRIESAPETSLSRIYAKFVRAILKEACGDLAGALEALHSVELQLANTSGTSSRTVELGVELGTRIGMLSLELRDPHGAMKRLTKVPETPFVCYLIGTCYFDLSEYETAIDYLARALYSAEDDRTRLLSSYQLGVAEYRRGRYSEALRHLSRCTGLLGCGSLSSGLVYEAIVASANRLGDYETVARYTPLLAMHVTGFTGTAEGST